jgi:hypothetical protein
MNQNSNIDQALTNLDDAIRRLSALRDLIQENRGIIRSSTIDEHRKIEAELSLRGAMLLYESYAQPLSAYIGQLSSESKKEIYREKSSSIAFALDGEWVSHELSRFLGALNYLHNLSTLDTKLRSTNVSYRLERPQSRSDIYRNAKLYFYLSKSEELKIRKIHISSPGVVEFVTSNFEYGTLIISVLYVANRFPKWFDEVITIWNRRKAEIRKNQIQDRIERNERMIDDFFEQEILPKLRNSEYCMDNNGFIELKKAIDGISQKKLADPISTMDHTLMSIAVLVHLKQIGKYQVLKQDDSHNA